MPNYSVWVNSGSASGSSSEIRIPVANVTDSTTLGQNLVKSTDPNAIAFVICNANNTVSWISASSMITALGAATETEVAALRAVGTDTHFVTGFLNQSDTTISISTRTVSISPTGTNFSYYLDGVKVTKTGGATCQVTYAATVGLWYIYFDNTGQLVASQTPWSYLNSLVFTALSYWNGSEGTRHDERHFAGRDLANHQDLHLTRGTAYASGLSQTYPSAGNDGIFQVESGRLQDEELPLFISQQKRLRIWYQTAGGVWTWVDGTNNGGFDRPYLWNSGTSKTRFPDSSNSYTLTDLAANRYQSLWLYGSNDMDRPLYLVVPAMAGGNQYNSATAAQTEAPPSSLPMPEMKLLFRWVYSGGGTYQSAQANDYRLTTSLPGGVQSAVQHNDTLNKQVTTTAGAGEFYHMGANDAAMVSQIRRLICWGL